MVNVAAIHRNIVERADIVANRKGEHAHYQHGGEESERCKEQTFAPRFCESVVVNPLQSGVRNNRTHRIQKTEFRIQKPEPSSRKGDRAIHSEF
jgi:hypothetical protein